MRFVQAVAILLVFSGAVSAAAPNYGQTPPNDVIILSGGYEWIWAAPCSPVDPSCGKPDQAFGFHIPSAAEWLASFADRAALMAAFTDPNGGAICGSPWMSSTHNHCDFQDATNGHIFQVVQTSDICDPNYFNGCSAATTESFLVRGGNLVPLPATLYLMLAGLTMIGVARRRSC